MRMAKGLSFIIVNYDLSITNFSSLQDQKLILNFIGLNKMKLKASYQLKIYPVAGGWPHDT
jgi:hypothetical protein